ncbi:MAG: DUF47 family protein [Bacteroidales bacterium]|nr:DUF47 family protein [Bacteroidales bacterium]
MKTFKKKKKFTKQESRFLPILNQQAEYVKKAATILSRMVETADEQNWIRCENEIKQYEVKGDAILAEFYSTFYETVIPMVNRVDLQVIALSIDEFLDQINSCAKSILLYKPEKFEYQFQDIAHYIARAAEAVQQIIKDLEDIHENFSSITHQCESITELEHATDELYEDYVAQLFQNEKDAITLIKNKNMIEVFEATTDGAKDISDHIRMFQLRFL